jgi:cytochrome c oxidase subunit II
MSSRLGLASGLLAGSFLALAAAPALADTGHPSPWQINFQGAVTPIAEQIHEFSFFINIIIAAVVLFVLVLLAICAIRFNEKANPVPSRTTHHVLLEVVWTIAPVLILVIIAIPSFRLLYAQYDMPKADVTLKVTGKQWFWTVEYQTAEAPAGAPAAAGAAHAAPAAAAGNVDFGFDALMIQRQDIKEGQIALLSVDNEVVVPINKVVRVQVTGADVIHAFAIPSFGIKVDAVPGRLNETWFKAEREGIYYGQCSELCGKDHAFMPIAVRVVSDADYQAWVVQARQKFAMNPPTFVVADATPAAR